MTQTIRHLMAPGTKLTRTKLRDLLYSAATTPRLHAGFYGGIIGSTRQGAGTIQYIKRHPIPQLKELDVLITGINVLETNRWEYEWAQARLNALNDWQILPGGKDSDTYGLARNKAEFLNTATVVAHGVILPVPPPTITVVPIPIGTPVTIRLLKDVNGLSQPWFSEVNAINVTC